MDAVLISLSTVIFLGGTAAVLLSFTASSRRARRTDLEERDAHGSRPAH
jgi:hypothetical protein